jgi:hypothetical protein
MTPSLNPARTRRLWPPTPKRRLHPRYPASGVRAFVVREETEYILPVRLLNVSAGGLRLRLGNRPRVGAQLTVRLHNPVNNWSCVRHMAVVYDIMQDDGAFVAGAAFTEELDETELKLLLGDPLPDVPADVEDTPPTLVHLAGAGACGVGRRAGSSGGKRWGAGHGP